MKLTKTSITYFVITLLSLGALILESQTLYGGRFVNGLFPCRQLETNSAPCSIGYDFIWLVILGIILIIFTAFFIVEVIKSNSTKGK